MSDSSPKAVSLFRPPRDSTALDEVEGHAEHIRGHLPDLNRYLYVSLELITELRSKNIISEEMAQEMHGYESNKINIRAVGVLTNGVLPNRMFWDQFKHFCQILWNPIQQRSVLKFVIPKKLQNNADYLKSVFGPVAKIEVIPDDEPVPIQLYIKQPTLQFCSLCDRKLADAAAAKHYTKKYAKELITKLQLLTDWPADIQHEVEMAESGEGATVSVTCPTGQFLDKLMDASEKGYITDHLQIIIQNDDPNKSIDDLKEAKVEIEEKAACNTRMAITDAGYIKMSKAHLESLSKVLETDKGNTLLTNLKHMKLPNITEKLGKEEALEILEQQPDSFFFKAMSTLLPSGDSPKYSDIVNTMGTIQVQQLERILLKAEWPPETLGKKCWEVVAEAQFLTVMPGGLIAAVGRFDVRTYWADSGKSTGCAYEVDQYTSGVAFHSQLGILLVRGKTKCYHLEPTSLELIREVTIPHGRGMAALASGDIATMTEVNETENEEKKLAIEIRKADSGMELIRQIAMVETYMNNIDEIMPGVVAGSSILGGLSLYDINTGKHMKTIDSDISFRQLATDKYGFIWTCTPYNRIFVVCPENGAIREYGIRGDKSTATAVAITDEALYTGTDAVMDSTIIKCAV